LLADEADRAEAEAALVAQFQAAITDAEIRGMRQFVMHLPMLTAALLEMTDAFLVPDDLQPGPTVGVQRRTMKEMIKEKERRAAGSDPGGRPFARREWPSLPLVMEPMAAIAPPPGDQPAQVVKETRGKKGAKGAAVPSDAKEAMATNESLDTPLSRRLIVERNKSYEQYQEALARRLRDFATYVESLQTETEAFAAFWAKRVAALKEPNRTV
jgi:hypothetical protein